MPIATGQPPKSGSLPQGKAALIVAHPGHELRIHGWLEIAKPLVLVLTDGSGGAGESRLECTRGLLMRIGAQPAKLFGRFADRTLYQGVIDQNFSIFTSLVDELATTLEGQGIAYVVGDAIEGYNPAHDVCRVLIDAAIGVTASRCGREVLNFAYPLTGSPSAVPPGCSGEAVQVHLDEIAYSRKLQAADEYAPLHQEVKAAFGGAGRDAFRVEYFFPALSDAGPTVVPSDAPFYERYGEQQVKAGRYKSVLRYKEHFVPLREAVSRHVKMQLI